MYSEGVIRRVRDRLVFLARRAAKKAKASRYRYLILNEWHETEVMYRRDLQRLMSLRTQMEQVCGQNLREIFINIDAIGTLSEEMGRELQAILADFDVKSTMIGSRLAAYSPFFKIYSEFCNGYTTAEERLKSLRTQHEDIEAFLNEKEGSAELSGLSFESLLIKPVQRVPKYVLFLNDYLKKLDGSHPDIPQVVRARDLYIEVNAHNDKVMGENVSSQVLISLENKFGNILSASRNFVERRMRFTLFFYHPFRINLYLFSDMILITKDTQDRSESKHSAITLNSSSYYYQIPSGKYFKHYLFLSGANTCNTIQAVSDVDRNGFLETFKSVITALQQKKKEEKRKSPLAHVQVKAIAAERRYSSKKGYTVRYIVEYETPSHRVRRDYGLSDFELVESELFSDKIPEHRLPLVLSSSLMEFYDIQKNKTEILEFRKISFTEYLNRLFKLAEMERDHFRDKYLTILRLPAGLFMAGHPPDPRGQEILAKYGELGMLKKNQLLEYYQWWRKRGIEKHLVAPDDLQVTVHLDSVEDLPFRVMVGPTTLCSELLALVCK
jgi:hypothetical protein